MKRNVIFYVDDDQDDLDLFQMIIDDIGGDLTLFTFGAELLKCLHNPPPQASIVFLDLNMPGKSGFEILQEIKASPSLKDIPVVILSTASDEATVERCKKLGADFYMCKLFSVKQMTKALEYVLNIDWDNPPKQFVFCEEHLIENL